MFKTIPEAVAASVKANRPVNVACPGMDKQTLQVVLGPIYGKHGTISIEGMFMAQTGDAKKMAYQMARVTGNNGRGVFHLNVFLT